MSAEAIDHRIGILVGGGPAPGINGVIYAATMEAYHNHREIIGIYDGFKHLMEGEVVGIPLLPDTVGYIHKEGGSILRTARANPTKSEKTLRSCVAALLDAGITSLVSIGGDDTAFSASRVAHYAQETMGVRLNSVHVPKTIDNDLPLPEDIPTFGFETARALGAQLTINLKRDAATNQHWFLVMTMGRKAGHLALGIGTSAVATLTLIPEEWAGREIRLQEVVDILATSVLMRMLDHKRYGVAILAEGILENLAHEDLEALDHVERDEHGHIRLAEVNFLDILKRNLDRDLDRMEVHMRFIKQVLGYESTLRTSLRLRCGVLARPGRSGDRFPTCRGKECDHHRAAQRDRADPVRRDDRPGNRKDGGTDGGYELLPLPVELQVHDTSET